MTIRNALVGLAVVFFIVAFFVTPDGCAGYTSEDNVHFVCMDPSGIGQLISQIAHWLFAGLAILSVAMLDADAILQRRLT